MSMYPHELPNVMLSAKEHSREDSVENIKSSCYFMDNKGKLHEFDFVEFVEGDLIVSKSYRNRNG